MSLVAIVLFRAPFWSRVLRLGLAIGFEELRIAAYHLGRLTERPDECAPHPFAIRKAGFGGDRLNRMACLLHHYARGLDPRVLDRLGGGLAGFGAKRAAELARAEIGHAGEYLDRQYGSELAPAIDNHPLEPVTLAKTGRTACR